MNVPKICTVADMKTALIQLQGLEKNRTAANSIGLFVRSISETGNFECLKLMSSFIGMIRYDSLNLKTLAKKPIRDANIQHKAQLILDPNNEIPNLSKS
jgi:hypothetical protein